MININDYILEKLHISAKLTNNNDFIPEDNFLIISLYENTYDIFSDLKVISIEKYDEDDNKYKLKYHAIENDKDITRILYINDKGYFQKDCKETSKYLNTPNNEIESLFLTNKQALKFINNIDLNKPLNDLLKKEYFDSSNKNKLSNYSITISDTDMNNIMHYLK